MISPKIRSFAKLIALLGNERKVEKTSSRMSIPEKINKPRNSRTWCAWGATSNGQEKRGSALSKLKCVLPAPHYGPVWQSHCWYSPPLGTRSWSSPVHWKWFFHSSSPQCSSVLQAPAPWCSALGLIFSLCFSFSRGLMTLSPQKDFKLFNDIYSFLIDPTPPCPERSRVHPVVATISRYSIKAANLRCAKHAHFCILACLLSVHSLYCRHREVFNANLITSPARLITHLTSSQVLPSLVPALLPSSPRLSASALPAPNTQSCFISSYTRHSSQAVPSIRSAMPPSLKS